MGDRALVQFAAMHTNRNGELAQSYGKRIPPMPKVRGHDLTPIDAPWEYPAGEFVEVDFSPVCYLHWGGSEVPALLRQCATIMHDRPGDLEYTFARFVGVCHTTPGLNDSCLSLGVWNADGLLTEEYSHGDNGVFVIWLPEWSVWRSTGEHFSVREFVDMANAVRREVG